MKINITKKIFRKFLAISLFFVLTSISFTPYLNTPISPTNVFAADACTASSASPGSNSGVRTQARVGGVALDQAAKFLADMTDIIGAYYDSTLDRIIFVGKKNTTLPKFDKDDLAVAIKTIIFNRTLPWFSLESNASDPNLFDAVYASESLIDTKFGKVLFDADVQLKKYAMGHDENNQAVISNVSGYKSFNNIFIDKHSTSIVPNNSRFWITPEYISLIKDDTASSFIFETTKMQVKTEFINPNNDPKWNEAAQEFATHQTDHFDEFAFESSSYASVKQIGKIAAVVKWIYDNDIATDFNWARDYAPKYVSTPRNLPKFPPTNYSYQVGNTIYSGQIFGGAELFTPNTYSPDTSGTSVSIKNSSQGTPTTKEDIHWTFTKDGQQYESVAVTADAFRSLGSYNTSVVDMSFPTAGDLTLAFQRSYSSYSGGQYGIGRGWNIYPATLYDNDPTHEWYCSGNTYPRGLALMSQTGGFESFRINDCAIGYVPDDPAYNSQVFRNSDGTFTARLTNQTEFLFDSSYRLTKIKDKIGNTITYNYEGSSRKLTSIVDSKNHQITLNYTTVNGQTLISSISDWSGRVVNYTYDNDGNLLTVKDPNGNVTTYAYDTNFKLTGITDRTNQLNLTNTYTDEAKIATQKNAANITNTFSYDKVNRKIKVADNQTPIRTQVTTYDTKARILEQQDPANFSLKYTYGTELPPLTITDKNGNKITNTYDTNGNLTSITNPDTKKITYQYDTKNRLTKIIDERYGITPKQTTFTYNVSGNLTQMNESGLASNYTYDTSGEMLTRTDPLLHKTTWTRDSFGNKLTEVNALNNATAFVYDAIARLTKITDPDLKVTSYTYDNNGNLLTETTASGTTTNTFDKENRPVKTTLPNNTVTEYVYNASGSQTSTKDAALSLTSYGYDSYQNLTSQQDALLKTTTYTYDALNRQTQSKTPLLKVSKWEYDANGNITKRIDANNNTTPYTYDAFNRLTKITYPDTKTVTFEYDSRGNRTKMIDPVGTSTYTYDNFDRLTQAINAYGKVLKYTYDNANNLKTITYPDSGTVTYTYDNNNRLTKVTDWKYKVTTYTYNKNGTLATRLLPNYVKTTYTYDAANRIKTITHSKSTTTLAKYDYTRDPIGNITSVTESGSFIGTTSQTPTFTYDSLGRITKAVYPGNNIFEYTYDKMGNRLTQKVNGSTTTPYNYDDDYRLIKKNNFTSYTYDNNGNQTKKPSENFNPDPTYSYDFENKLIGHTTAAGNVYDWKYDGLGTRLRKNMATAVTRYIYDISGPLSRLMAISGDENYASTFWIYGQGLLYDTDSNYYLEDATGSMRFIANSSGSKRSGANYDPFGNIRSSSGILPDFQFQTQQLDSGSNLYFLRARYYDPELGRFISRDPVKGILTNPQTQNPYAYALNNPVNLSDPSGLEVYGLCAAASLGLGVYGTCSVCLLYNPQEGFRPSLTVGGGGTTGFASGIGIQGQYSTASSFQDVRGQDIFGGASYGEMANIGTDFSIDKNDPNIKTQSINAGLGFDVTPPFFPFEFHGGSTYTWVP